MGTKRRMTIPLQDRKRNILLPAYKEKGRRKEIAKTAVMKVSSKYSLLTQKNKYMSTIAPWAEFTCKTIQNFQTERLHSVPPHFGSVKVSQLVSMVCPTGGIHKIIGKFSLLSEWQEPNSAKSMMNTMIFFFNYPFGIKKFCKHWNIKSSFLFGRFSKLVY